MARTDLLFGFGCRLTERLDEGQVLVGGELEDAKQTLKHFYLSGGVGADEPDLTVH